MPKMTELRRSEFKRFELKYADSRKMDMELMIGTERETRRRRRKATRERIESRGLNMREE